MQQSRGQSLAFLIMTIVLINADFATVSMLNTDFATPHTMAHGRSDALRPVIVSIVKDGISCLVFLKSLHSRSVMSHLHAGSVIRTILLIRFVSDSVTT